MRRSWLIPLLLAAFAMAGPTHADPLTGIAPPILKAAIDAAWTRPSAREVDPQAGANVWGGDLERFIDQASGYAWRRSGREVQIGYQQRDFAPQTPGFETRGYEPMVKDASDMMGVSFRLRTR